MFFTDFSLINCILSILSICFCIAFTLGIMITSYYIPYYVLKWIMYCEEENNDVIKKSFDYESSQEEDSLLLSKLFQKDK